MRKDFPILQRRIGDNPLIYFDNAATTQKPLVVLDALDRFYREYNSNVHRGVHLLSQEATAAFEAARETVRHFLGAAHAREVVFTRGTTEAVNLVANAWGRANVAAGDEVLVSLAAIMNDSARESDLIARYGGEEFMLYFPDTGVDRAMQVCSELRQAVQGADWSDIAPDFVVTISFGLAEIRDHAHSRTILDEADTRLYRAKREGRNRVIAA